MEDENVMSQDDFLKAFGITGEADQDSNDGQETNADDSGNTEDANNADPGTEGQNNESNNNNDASQNGDNVDSDDAQNNANNDSKADKTSQAFAAMRVELAQKNKMLESVATVLGLDPKSKDSFNQLQSKLTEALAKKQGLPVETLERLNRLEILEEQRNSEQIRNNALTGFQRVKTQFGLNDEQLQAFANELVAEGKNPFVTPLDLVTEYKLKNFDKLLEQARNQGIQAEIERASKANNNASTPSNTQGGTPDADAEQITTVKQLTDWFNQQQSGK